MPEPIDKKKTAQPEESKQAVKYDTIKLSVPEVIAALHQKAIAAVADKTLRIANSAIESDGKQTKLNSAGQHIISALPTEEGKLVEKEAALKALQTYVQWFVGPDLAKKVTDKVILPLGGGEAKNESVKIKSFMDFFLESLNEADDEAEEATDQEDSDDADEEDDAAEGTDGEDASEESPEGEDADSETGEGNGEGASEEGGVQTDENGKESAPGWYIAYDLKVQGLKETPLKDAMKDFAVKFFDNIKLTASGLFGGGDTITGKDIRKQFHDLTHVDHKKLAENVSDYLSKKFPNVKEIDVKARDSKTLYREVKSSPQLTKDDKAAITAAAYCIWIKVKEENPQKPFLNKVKIAEAIKKSMAFFRIGKKAQITKDSIIKIENFVDTNDDESFANNAKRPDASVIKELLNKKEYQPDKKGNLAYTSGLELFNKIKKLFASISKNKKAMEEKENKEAMAILKKLEDKCTKVKDGEEFKAKDFDDFYQAYLKFEASLGESIASASLIQKPSVAKMILEMLFEDLDADEITPQQMLEADDTEEEEAGEEADEEGSEGGESEESDAPAEPVEVDPDYNDFSDKLKAAVKQWISSKKSKSAVMSRDDAIKHLEDFYDVAALKSDSHRSCAVIDFHPESNIAESLEEKLIGMLFEENEPAEDDSKKEDAKDDSKKDAEAEEQPKDKILSLVSKAFDQFKTDAPVPADQAGSIVNLETSLEESLRSDGRIMLLEAKDFITQIEDDITTAAQKLGKTKMKNPKLHNTYDINAGKSSSVVDYLKGIGIGSSGDYEKIQTKGYAVALVIKQPKETEEKFHNGSHGAAAFTDDAVKKAFQDSFNGSADFEYLVLTGTSSSIKYYNSKTNADVKVFVAAFDENIKKDVKKPDDPEPKPEDKAKKDGKKARAFVLPFTLMKTPDTKKPGDEPEPSGDVTPTGTEPQKAEGTDLYIYPIASSKDFEEGKDLGND